MTGHVQDLWMCPGPNGRKVRSKRYGKGKRWQARWVEVGKEKAKVFATQDEANRHLALLEIHGPFTPRPRTTFGEYATTWRLSQVQHRPRTADSAEGIFRLMLAPQLGRLPLAEVTRQDVQNAIIEWQAHYAPSRVHVAYGYVATIYKLAVLDGLVEATKNPCRRISLPAVTTKRVTPLTLTQLKQIADNIHPDWRSAVVVCASSGLRIGELGGLTHDRIGDRLLKIDRQLIGIDQDKTPVFGPPKSSKSNRDVPIGDVAWQALQQHMQDHPDNPHGLVWVSRRNLPMTRTAASAAWREATKGMKLWPRSGWHSLRHYHASVLISRGLSARAVADRLGHKDVSVTLNVYSHLMPNDQERAVGAADEALGDL